LNGRIYLLSELPNEQGLVDMGCLSDMLPGGRPATVDIFRKRYEEFFGVEIPSRSGLSLMEMIDAAHVNKIKAMYVMGEDLVFNIPNTKYVKGALSNLDFLVVHDIFMTETAMLADVVLPSLSWAEKEGSYTNLERRMQLLRKAVDGNGMEDWRAISEVCRMLGFDMKYRNSKDVMAEIAKVSPLHKDISYEDMENGECMWPYKGEPLRHGVSIEGIEMPDIKSLLKRPDKGRIYAGIDNPLFLSEALSKNSAALTCIAPEPYVRIGKALSEKLSIADGDYVSISTDAGSIELFARIDSDIPENIVLIPNYFDDKGIYKIMNWKINPVIKSPAMDYAEVIIRKVTHVSKEST
jgi:predicted molibdopterin-dependent oxidoreductase YjgC